MCAKEQGLVKPRVLQDLFQCSRLHLNRTVVARPELLSRLRAEPSRMTVDLLSFQRVAPCFPQDSFKFVVLHGLFPFFALIEPAEMRCKDNAIFLDSNAKGSFFRLQHCNIKKLSPCRCLQDDRKTNIKINPLAELKRLEKSSR